MVKFEMIESGTAQLPNWRSTAKHNLVAEILLSEQALAGWNPLEANVGGADFRVTMLDPAQQIPEAVIDSGHVLILEVRRDSRPSVERLAHLLEANRSGPVIAAMRDPSLDDARNLLRAGAVDIVSLPLQRQDVEAAIGRIRAEIESGHVNRGPSGRIVSVIKGVGGVGATALLTQIACIHAGRERAAGRETCLIDFDIQFGNAALYLGSLPKLGLQDLVDAGARADGSMLRSTAADHSSGLQFVAAPPDLMPVEGLQESQVSTIIDLAAREFGTVFIDLPASWTNWSLSALARSDLILLVTDLTVAGLHQARRQLDFLRQQELGEIPLRIVVNRVERKMFKSIDLKDAVRVLGQGVDFAVATDAETVGTALDQGILVSEVSARSRATRDIQALAAGVAEALVGAD